MHEATVSDHRLDGRHGVQQVQGARFRIIEAFQGRPEFYIDTTETVEKLDATGIRLVRRFAGAPVLQLSHTWSACEGHTHYVSVLEVGSNIRLFTLVNRYLTGRLSRCR